MVHWAIRRMMNGIQAMPQLVITPFGSSNGYRGLTMYMTII